MVLKKHLEKYPSSVVFLDTEFTTLTADMELISMGFVDLAGKRSLYIELNDYDVKSCTYFVFAEVLPHLGEIKHPDVTYHFGPLESLKDVITSWLAVYPESTNIAVNHGFDWRWLREALVDDFPPAITPEPLLLDERSNGPGFDDAYLDYLSAKGIQHHALWDAHALRHAYLNSPKR